MRLPQKLAISGAMVASLAFSSCKTGEPQGGAVVHDDSTSGDLTLFDPTRRMIFAIPQYEGVDERGQPIVVGHKYIIDSPSQISDRIIRAVQERITAKTESIDGEEMGLFTSLAPNELRALLDRSETVQLADSLSRTWLVAGLNGDLVGDRAAQSFDHLVEEMARALIEEVKASDEVVIVEQPVFANPDLIDAPSLDIPAPVGQ